MVASELYNQLIRYRIANPLPEEVEGENHHIVPKSCGGKDLQDNLIKLTIQEHYEAHKLLAQIYATGKEHRSMVYSCHLIAHSKGVALNDEEVVALRSEYRKSISGENNPMKGKHMPESARKKLSDYHKGKPLPESVRKKISKANKGRKTGKSWNRGKKNVYSEDTLERMSKAQKGKPRPWLRGLKQSEETRRKRSESIKAWHARRKQQN